MYKFNSLGSITLPIYDPQAQQDPAGAQLIYLESLAGGYDALGGADARTIFPYNISYSCIAAADTAATVRALVDSLRAVVGKRLLLERQALDDAAEVHVAYARLATMPYVKSSGNILHQPLVLNFSIESGWYGKGYNDWYTESGEGLDSGVHFGTDALVASYESPNHEFAYVHEGNVTIRDAILKVTVGGSDTTSTLTFHRVDGAATDFWVRVTSSLSAGDVVVLDAGARICTINGSDAYSTVSHNLTHKVNGFFELIPTSPSGRLLDVDSDLTSSSTIELMYVEQWS